MSASDVGEAIAEDLAACQKFRDKYANLNGFFSSDSIKPAVAPEY